MNTNETKTHEATEANSALVTMSDAQKLLCNIVDAHDDYVLACNAGPNAPWREAATARDVAISEIGGLLAGGDPAARALFRIALAGASCEGSMMHDDYADAAFDNVVEDGAKVLGEVLP